MEKVFYIRKAVTEGSTQVPTTDRFRRIEKLNLLVDSGWVIKGFRSDAQEEYFLLEKADS